jgi:hypothetical protein
MNNKSLIDIEHLFIKLNPFNNNHIIPELPGDVWSIIASKGLSIYSKIVLLNKNIRSNVIHIIPKHKTKKFILTNHDKDIYIFTVTWNCKKWKISLYDDNFSRKVNDFEFYHNIPGDDHVRYIQAAEKFIIPANFWNIKEFEFYRYNKFSYYEHYRGYELIIHSEPNQNNTNINIYCIDKINNFSISLSEFNDITMFLGS